MRMAAGWEAAFDREEAASEIGEAAVVMGFEWTK